MQSHFFYNTLRDCVEFVNSVVFSGKVLRRTTLDIVKMRKFSTKGLLLLKPSGKNPAHVS